ncbi:MAG: hypothetical protein ACLQBJ_12910 [Bryobacteraceae bacterium]
MKLTLIVCTVLAVVSLGGCRKNLQTNDAVRQGVMNYLSQNKNLSLNMMDIELREVKFHDQEADAVVLFKPKGGDPASGMSMRYTLEQQNGAWVVKKKADSGAHGAAVMPRPSMPLPSPSGALPPGHPGMGGGVAPPETKK